MTYKGYVVKEQDTLYGIIRRYYGGFSNSVLKMIMDVNKLKDPSNIKVGQKIVLPGNWQGDKVFLKPELVEYDLSPNVITKMVNRTEHAFVPRAGKPPVLPANLPARDYWAEKYHKSLVVLHFTAGYSADSAIATFKQPGRVATPFVIGRDGRIHRLFDERCWAYHLGVKKPHTANWNNDKRSIGYEIVNIGPVWNKGGVYKDYVGKAWDKKDIVLYKNKDAVGGVKFPEVQMDAVIQLLNWTLTEYDIPRQIVKNHMDFCLPAVGKFNGVATHQCFRTDKYDMGPAFDMKRLIAECGLKVVTL